MGKLDSIGLRAVFSLMLLVGLFYMPAPAFSQDEVNIQNLILNGDFEEGFQGEFGVGYGWGGFSNGNASVGWNGDAWDKVVVAGKNAQLIEIRDATELNRYAGIYQTVAVVPGEQYKLTIKGMVRSSEGDIEISDYGYRLQYAIDQDGGTTWELLGDDAWVELPWDEQPLNDPSEDIFRIDSFETTITAEGEQLTLFIRGWKKWINNGSGIFDLDEISLVGPAPTGFQSPQAQVAAVENAAMTGETESGVNDQSASASPEIDRPASEQPQTATAPDAIASMQTDELLPQVESSQLPVSGQGKDDAVNYIVITSGLLLLILFVGAVTATVRQRNPVE